MKTIVLASGTSSRMAPLTDKMSIPFLGQTIFAHLLGKAHQGGASHFLVVGNPDNEADLRTQLDALPYSYDFTLQTDHHNGQAGGVLAGLSLLTTDEPVLIMSGANDYVTAAAYAEVIQTITQGADGALLAKRMTDYFPGGYLSLHAGTQQVQSIIEKPPKGQQPSDLVNIVCHAFASSQQLQQALTAAASSADDHYEVALQHLCDTTTVQAVPYADHWQPLKYPWHVLDMTHLMLSQLPDGQTIDPTATVAETARLRGQVVIAPGAKVFDYATIVGPAYIGAEAIVGNGALVRASIIGARSVVGYNTEIARSHLAPDVTTHLAYVGDSVVASGVNFGAYSTTANLRLDHAPVKFTVKGQRLSTGRQKFGAIVGTGAQIGVHACLMPGTRVEAGQLVPPSSVFPPPRS